MIAIELERETDGRWLADCPDIHGAMAYGSTPIKAVAAVLKLVGEIRPSLLEG